MAVLLFLLINLVITDAEREVSCGLGEYLVDGSGEQPDRCEQCAKHYYQDKKEHRETKCKSCSTFDHAQWELTLEHKCTPKGYEIIECISGYQLRDGVCHALHCGPGEHLAPGENGHADVCKPCRPDFYQEKENHRETVCYPCTHFDEYIAAHKEIAKHCTRFSDTKIKCYEDFYKREGDCYLCTDCSADGKKQVQACQNFQDTICCDEGMVVRDGKCENTVPEESKKGETIETGAGYNNHESSEEIAEIGSASGKGIHINTCISVAVVTAIVGIAIGVAVPAIITKLERRRRCRVD